MKQLERKYQTIWRNYVNSLAYYGLSPTPKLLTKEEEIIFAKTYYRYQEKIMNLGIILRWNS